MKLSLSARALTSIAVGTATLLPVLFQPFAVEAADSGMAPSGNPAATGRATTEFEGKTLDLSTDWGAANACHVDAGGDVTCYRTEAEMNKAIGTQAPGTSKSTQRESLRAANCSSSLRLYRDNYYNGPVIYLSQRYTWINLSWYGFNNVTSSYKVGACNTTFRSGNNGGGSTYGGGTYAWANRNYMGSWNNVLSSVRIS